jgi:energy-coupling factor transport system permease protein
MSRAWFQLDPRTTLLTVVLLNVVMFSAAFTGSDWWARLIFMVIPAVLAVGAGRVGPALVYAVVAGSAFAAESLTWASGLGNVDLAVGGLASLCARLVPGLFMCYVAVVSIRVAELMASLEALRLPRYVVIPAAVILRFLPTLVEESRSVQGAMRARGLAWGRVGPLSWFEYRGVPLIVSTVRSGEDLSQAALTRGLGRPIRATRLARIGLRLPDVLVLAALAAGIAVWLVR